MPAFHLPGARGRDHAPAGTAQRRRLSEPALVRMWRELIAATIRLQGPFTVAVYAPDERPGYWDLARDHYGSHTRYVTCLDRPSGPRGHGRSAAIGVLPMPEQDDPDPWWRALRRQ